MVDCVHLSSWVAMFIPVSIKALPFTIVVSRFVCVHGGCCHLRGGDVGSKQVIGDGCNGVLSSCRPRVGGGGRVVVGVDIVSVVTTR